MYDEGPKVVVIGGGNGINTVIKGLKKYTNNITAIVTMSDLNKENLPYGEIKGSIVALSDQEELMKSYSALDLKMKPLEEWILEIYILTAMNEMFEYSISRNKKRVQKY